jgi:glyoxylase-like metal-dependent hydrolase (beta-lactamase superfamily II)
MTFELGRNVNLKVVETLGHASHHQSYFETLHGGLFPGDAAGIYIRALDAVVPTTPPPFKLDTALASLEKLARLSPTVLYYSHFGNVKNPIQRLEAYGVQLKLWASIAQEELRNKHGFEQIRSRIVENDESLRRVLQFVKNHPVLNKTVLENSIMGVMKYAEKFVNAS